MLNKESVPSRLKSIKGWTQPTITRLLSNTKYIGKWIWNKRETRKPALNWDQVRTALPQMPGQNASSGTFRIQSL